MGYKLTPTNFTAAHRAELHVHYERPGLNELKGKTSAEIYYAPFGQPKVQWPVFPTTEWTYLPSQEAPTLIKIPLMPTAGDTGLFDSLGGAQDSNANTGTLTGNLQGPGLGDGDPEEKSILTLPPTEVNLA